MSKRKGRPLRPGDLVVLNALRSLGFMSYQQLKRIANLPRGRLYSTILKLRDYGLVVSERKGQFRYHRLMYEGKTIAERAVKTVETRLEVDRVSVGLKEIGERVQYSIDDMHNDQRALKKAQVKLVSTIYTILRLYIKIYMKIRKKR